MTILGYDDNLH